ncbi:MAG TPA: 3-hydroxyacyl-CoA dehydrogenase NAD-binding domain-containing protein [Phycisphaerae bacterium]|nr:3-hydroxyacyl-CoA dehydrogenase NAD-binding domain-containing protein [Phycisphaerae bacterium]HRW55916.1 3-hydroxyacyl-CoA dehydrogenase NAD-binding domain-containing protein [Phycisphaerae bacterium]
MSERLFGVIGSGTMGAGIAHAAAEAGFVVRTLDTDPALVRKAYDGIRERLDSRVQRGKLPAHDRDATLANLNIAESMSDFAKAEVVVEAVPENFELKTKIFADLEKVVSDRTLLATNTSSLSVTKLSSAVQRKDRFLGMHFFNPAPIMKLVELVSAEGTSDQALVDARAVCAKLDKTAVKVKDSPGFIGNRVNRPFYLEALTLLEQGEADVPAIDSAMRNVGGFRMGPFELLDLIGMDVNLSVTEVVYNDFGRPARFTPSKIQQGLVAEGHLGRKTGRGFYTHGDGDARPAYQATLKDTSGWQASDALKAFAAELGKPADRSTWLYARILLAVMNEAALAADSIAIPRDVNITMELGFNYPEGPLSTADYVGLDIVRKLLAEFYSQSGQDERYKPNPLLDKHVEEGNLGEKTARGFLYHAL